MVKITGLPVFSDCNAISRCIREPLLRSPLIKRVVCYALGPKGNNIEQAAALWLFQIGISDKAEVVLIATPELCLECAKNVTEDGVIAVFWTDAVYVGENKLFFNNPGVFPFFYQQEMQLDEMQLAVRPDISAHINGTIPTGWRIASHSSPAPIIVAIKDQLHIGVVPQSSSTAAAAACAKGHTELCITTESGRNNYGLVKVHSFGSPNMIFFGGITQHGLNQLKSVFEAEKRKALP